MVAGEGGCGCGVVVPPDCPLGGRGRLAAGGERRRHRVCVDWLAGPRWGPCWLLSRCEAARGLCWRRAWELWASRKRLPDDRASCVAGSRLSGCQAGTAGSAWASGECGREGGASGQNEAGACMKSWAALPRSPVRSPAPSSGAHEISDSRSFERAASRRQRDGEFSAFGAASMGCQAACRPCHTIPGVSHTMASSGADPRRCSERPPAGAARCQRPPAQLCTAPSSSASARCPGLWPSAAASATALAARRRRSTAARRRSLTLSLSRSSTAPLHRRRWCWT